jgi:hypothetical protein
MYTLTKKEFLAYTFMLLFCHEFTQHHQINRQNVSSKDENGKGCTKAPLLCVFSSGHRYTTKAFE